MGTGQETGRRRRSQHEQAWPDLGGGLCHGEEGTDADPDVWGGRLWAIPPRVPFPAAGAPLPGHMDIHTRQLQSGPKRVSGPSRLHWGQPAQAFSYSCELCVSIHVISAWPVGSGLLPHMAATPGDPHPIVLEP